VTSMETLVDAFDASGTADGCRDDEYRELDQGSFPGCSRSEPVRSVEACVRAFCSAKTRIHRIAKVPAAQVFLAISVTFAGGSAAADTKDGLEGRL
jgi:hypothetical protein